MGFSPWGVKLNRRRAVAPEGGDWRESRPGGARARRGGATTDGQRRSAARIALVVLVFLAPHLLGGVYAWATAVLALLATVTLALALLAEGGRAPLYGEPLAALFVLVLLVSAVHALPLPAGLVAWISPTRYAHTLATAVGINEPAPTWVAWSQDPAGTWERVLFAVCTFAAYCSGRILTLRGRPTRLLAAVALSTVAVALSHLGHRLVSAHKVYGLYAPRFRTADGPILNMNNLAGLLALGLPVCLSLAIRREGAQRWAWIAAAGTIFATGLLAGSRAGLVVLVAAPVLFGCVFWGTRRRGEREHDGEGGRSRSASRVAVAPVVVALLAIGYGLADLAADDFLDTDYQDLSKFDMFRSAVDALLQDWSTAVFGVGRGAFRTALTPVVLQPIRMMYAECLPLQYAVEFGIPLATLFLGVLLWQLCRALVQWRSPVQLGGAVGVIALGLQNLLDFSLELAGIAVPAIVCLAASLPPPAGRAAKMRWGLQSWARAGLAIGAVLVVTLSYTASRHDIRLVQERLARLAQDRQVEAFWTELRDTVRYHPADATVAGLAAYEKMLEGSPDAAFWLNRTMQLAPSLGSPHIWAAHWLSSRGRLSQAEDELRAAGELEPEAVLNVLCSWLKGTPSGEFAVRIAPQNGARRRDILNRAAECLAAQFPLETAKVDRELLKEYPGHAAALLRTARRSLAAGDLAAAIDESRAARKSSPRLAEAVEIEATALIQLGKAQQAADLLASAQGRTDAQRRILFALATAQAHAGNAAGMRDTIDLLRVDSAARPVSLAEALAHQAACERTLGNPARALTAMVEAHRTSNAPGYQAAAASIAYELGQTDYVLRAWGELCDAQYGGQVYCDARDKLQREHALDEF